MAEQATQSQDGVSKTTPSLQLEEKIEPLTDKQREKILKRRLKHHKQNLRLSRLAGHLSGPKC